MLKSFSNYIEERNQANNGPALVGTPKVKLVADYDGPSSTKPPKSEVPYKTATGNIDPNKGSDKTGFANLGNKDLVYEPDCKGGNSKMTSLGKEIGNDWPSKTESFLQKTKNMSASEFAQHILSELKTESIENLPTITANKAGRFHPDPSESIRYVVALIKNNSKLLEHFVYDVKRAGILDGLIETVFEHGESYKHLSALLESTQGAEKARSLARAIFEHVGPPQGLDNMDDEHNDEDENRDEEDEEQPHDDSDIENSDMDDDDDMEDDNQDSEFDDEESEDDSDDEEMGPPEEDDDQRQDLGMLGFSPKKKPMPGNMMNAMNSYMRR